MLTLFGRIMKGDSPLLYNLSLRQLALKDFTSKSWFIHLVRLCGKYVLPLPQRLVDGSITPQSWNSLVKRTVFSFWFRTMSQDAITKYTMRFISIDLLLPGKVHPVWAHVYSNTRDTVRARIKAKLLTGSYTLQSNRARFNNNSVDPTCMLCGSEDEDTVHFLTACPSLAATRQKFTTRLQQIFLSHVWDTLAIDHVTFTHTLLDSNFAASEGIISVDDIPQWELYTRTLCFYLHTTVLHRDTDVWQSQLPARPSQLPARPSKMTGAAI